MPQSPSDRHAGLVAVTGATGFIGGHVLPALARAGFRLRVLTRHARAECDLDGAVEQVRGDLADREALTALVRGADVVIHLAGLIKARSRTAFFSVNRDGTVALAQTLSRHAPHARLILVSTLAAREPQLSAYAASNRAAEQAAQEILGERISILRPPAVYGPGDRETLIFFQLARRRLVPLPGTATARVTLIHVADLAAAFVALARQPPARAIFSLCDARTDGYRWDEIMRAAAAAVGQRAPRLVPLPGALLAVIAGVGDLADLLGDARMLTREKLRELRHPDWSIPQSQQVALPGWSPRFNLVDGFADAVGWYRRQGWLR